jgi:hypothetical protein
MLRKWKVWYHPALAILAIVSVVRSSATEFARYIPFNNEYWDWHPYMAWAYIIFGTTLVVFPVEQVFTPDSGPLRLAGWIKRVVGFVVVAAPMLVVLWHVWIVVRHVPR